MDADLTRNEPATSPSNVLAPLEQGGADDPVTESVTGLLCDRCSGDPGPVLVESGAVSDDTVDEITDRLGVLTTTSP